MKRIYFVLTWLTILGLAPALRADDPGPGAGTRQVRAEMDLSLLRAGSGDSVRVLWPKLRETPSRVSGLRWTSGDDTVETSAETFLSEFSGLTGADARDLELTDTERSRSRTVLHFQQAWRGYRVLGATVILSFDEAGTLLSMASSTTGTHDLDPSRDVGRDAALRAANERVLGANSPVAPEGRASRVVLPGPGGARLAWRVIVPTVPRIQKIVCIVDAASGAVIRINDEVIR